MRSLQNNAGQKIIKRRFIANNAFMYQTGEGGVLKDNKKALYWHEKSAKQGFPLAQSILAEMYQTGEGGVLKDNKKALYWYEKSAKQGFPRAQSVLASMYRKGEKEES